MVILVADDDRLIRFMMKSMLGDILECEYILLEAANGKEMVEICKEHQPDIVFADIKMPYMSGIEAIEECQRNEKGTQFVVISGYSEFEYARKAINLGVQDYLLKPVEEEKLREVVEKLQKKIVGKKRELNSHFQLKLFNMFNYFSTVGFEEMCEEEWSGEQLTYEVIGVKTRSSLRYRETYMQSHKMMIDSMNEFGKRMTEKGSYYACVYSAEGTPYFVFCTMKNGKEEILDFVKKLGWRRKESPFAIHFVYFSKTSMKDIYQECEKNDNHDGVEMNYPNGEIIDLKEVDISQEEREILKYTEKLLTAWENADAIAYKETLNLMYRKYKDREIGLNLKNIGQYCSRIMQQPVSYETYKTFCRSFVESSESMYENIENKDGSVIKQVKDYIERYYMNDIGIGQIAESFGITPNYLSTIFHQKAGCKFVDYLTEVRISNAKRLLIENETAAVKDIAVMVGYNSSRYFATLFQKITGVKPSTYRKENKKM